MNVRVRPSTSVMDARERSWYTCPTEPDGPTIFSELLPWKIVPVSWDRVGELTEVQLSGSLEVQSSKSPLSRMLSTINDSSRIGRYRVGNSSTSAWSMAACLRSGSMMCISKVSPLAVVSVNASWTSTVAPEVASGA